MRQVGCVLFFLAILWPGFFHAQGNEEDLKIFRAYFVSGDYHRAKLGYEGWLDKELEAWQKDVIRYNMATSLLADGHEEEAVRYFQMLLDDTKGLPLLRQRAQANLALSHALLLNKHLEALHEKKHPSHEDYHRIFFQFDQTFLDIDKAKAAWCALESSEGAADCSPSFDLGAMQLEMKIRFNRFLNEYLSFRLSHADIGEDILTLIFAEKLLVTRLTDFQQDKFSAEAEYRKPYLAQLESWKILWQTLKEKIEAGADSSARGEGKDFFDAAFQLFVESADLARQGDISLSLAKLEESKSALSGLLRQFIKKKSAKEMLCELLVAYRLVLIGKPISQESLEQLFDIQTDFYEKLNELLQGSLKEEYEKSQQDLKLSIHSLIDSHPIKARIFVEAAHFYIENIVEQVNFPLSLEPAAALESAIAKEEFVLLLNEMEKRGESEAKELADIDRLILELQGLVIKAANRFSDAVLTKQKAVFHSENKAKSRCQCRPWDEVIPLFYEGYSDAELAGRHLHHRHLKLNAEHLQRKAVHEWKEALAKMQISDSKSESPVEKQETQPQKQQQEEESQSSESSNEKFNEVLRWVQEMERDDGSKPLFKTATGSKKGDRQW